MRYGKPMWGVLLSLLLYGCASSAMESYQPKNPEEALVVATLMKIPNGINSRSLDMIMQPYAEDAYIGNFHKYLGVAAPGSPIARNKGDLRATYAQVFKDVKDVNMVVRSFHVVVSGDRAVAEGRTELTYKMEGGRGERRQDLLLNDVLWRLQRTPAGWKIKEEIYQ